MEGGNTSSVGAKRLTEGAKRLKLGHGDGGETSYAKSLGGKNVYGTKRPGPISYYA